MKKLQLLITCAIVFITIGVLVTSLAYVLSSLNHGAQWDRINEAWVLILILSTICILVSMRAVFRPMRKVEEMDARLRQILDNMSDGLQIIDPDWKYVYVNQAVAKQGKRSRESLIGQTMMDMYPGIEKTDMFRTLEKCMRSKSGTSIDNEFKFPDGTKGWFRLKMYPVPEGVMILSVDITDQVHALQSLEQRTKELEHLINLRTNLSKKYKSKS